MEQTEPASIITDLYSLDRTAAGQGEDGGRAAGCVLISCLLPSPGGIGVLLFLCLHALTYADQELLCVCFDGEGLVCPCHVTVYMCFVGCPVVKGYCACVPVFAYVVLSSEGQELLCSRL